MAVDTFTKETKHYYQNTEGVKHLWKPWMDEVRIRQITTLDELREFAEQAEAFERVSWDVETESLDPDPDKVVGHCLALTADHGIYIPTRHRVDTHENLDHDAVWDLVLQILKDKIVVVFNWQFEGKILRKKNMSRPSDLKFVRDVMIYNWLDDSAQLKVNLKLAAQRHLGREMIEIHEVPGVQHDDGTKAKKRGKSINFAYTKPSDATLYAASDPVMTLAILDKIGPAIEKEQALVLQLEHDLLDTLFEMQKNPVTIDRAVLRRGLEDIDRWIAKVTADLFQLAGYEFNPGSVQEAGQFLVKVGVPLPQTGTKKNGEKKYATGRKEVEKLAGEHKAVDLILLWRSLVKEKGTYITKLLTETTEENPKAHFNFKSVGAPTGRFASGKAEDGDAQFVSMNAQCLPADTLVYTPSGVRNLIDLREKEDRVWDGTSYQAFEGPVSSGVKALIRITTETGHTVRASKDHLIYTIDPTGGLFKPVSSLKPGDWVALNGRGVETVEGSKLEFVTTQRRNNVTVKALATDFWEIYGVALGDGFIKNDKGSKRGFIFVFGNHEKVERAYVKTQLAKMGYPTVEAFGRKKGYDDVLLLANYTKAGAEVFTRFGFETGAANKTLPPLIWKAAKSERAALLRGLFSADGGDGKYRTSVRFKTSSKKMAEEVQSLLLTLGFNSSLRGKDRSWCVIPWDKHRFFREIGFIPGEKRSRQDSQEEGVRSRKKVDRIPAEIRKKLMRSLVPEGRKRRFYGQGRLAVAKSKTSWRGLFQNEVYDLEVHWVKIAKIEKDVEQETWDIYVPGTNRFIADGLVVHNSMPNADKYQKTYCWAVENPPRDQMDEYLLKGNYGQSVALEDDEEEETLFDIGE